MLFWVYFEEGTSLVLQASMKDILHLFLFWEFFEFFVTFKHGFGHFLGGFGFAVRLSRDKVSVVLCGV